MLRVLDDNCWKSYCTDGDLPRSFLIAPEFRSCCCFEHRDLAKLAPCNVLPGKASSALELYTSLEENTYFFGLVLGKAQNYRNKKHCARSLNVAPLALDASLSSDWLEVPFSSFSQSFWAPAAFIACLTLVLWDFLSFSIIHFQILEAC